MVLERKDHRDKKVQDEHFHSTSTYFHTVMSNHLQPKISEQGIFVSVMCCCSAGAKGRAVVVDKKGVPGDPGVPGLAGPRGETGVPGAPGRQGSEGTKS